MVEISTDQKQREQVKMPEKLQQRGHKLASYKMYYVNSFTGVERLLDFVPLLFGKNGIISSKYAPNGIVIGQKEAKNRAKWDIKIWIKTKKN